MAEVIKLRKGLNINLEGAASGEVTSLPVVGMYGICPDNYYGLKPKVVVREGDAVKAGDALFVDKNAPELKVVSPVSGTVKAVERGDRRKVLAVKVEADGQQTKVDFGAKDVSTMSADDVKQFLAATGTLAYLRQRPYDITVKPSDTPKSIFVTAFSKMPLAADYSFLLRGQEENVKSGLKALSRIAKVYLNISPEQTSEPWAQTEDAQVTVFDGPNPSGNVGVQINHLDPVNKGDIVWTLNIVEAAQIGQVVRTGFADMTKTIALAGSEISKPHYVSTLVGTPLKRLLEGQLKTGEHVRIINGNPLVGDVETTEGFLAARVTEVTAIPEGDDVNEVLGWIRPRLKQFSASHTYFSWLFGKKKYNLDARVKGGERHIIMSGEYDKVLPMDIYGGYLIKAILTGDIDRMEQLGIYEVAPEDFAVAEFVDSSKLELQRIVREGLDMLRKEMA
jgi:Na+-transporting NADH:ubiquinone oxidoreductase subunit A